MPIAYCVINNQLTPGSSDLIADWSKAADVSADLLTLNLVESSKQFGVRYDVMATIMLPTAWSKAQASTIQLSLASVLSDFFSLPLAQVHVLTQWVHPGDVVENGEEQTW